MSVILSSREKKIIHFIIKSTTKITIQDISNEVGVSRRTVLREMNNVYSWFEEKNTTLDRNAKHGLFLDIPPSQKLYLLKELDIEKIDYYYTQKERQTFVVTELLQSSEQLKLQFFANMLNVSEATISKDLDKIGVWLQKYELKLERKQGYGITLLGNETGKRSALIDIMYETLDGDQIKDVIAKYVNNISQEKRNIKDIRKRLLDLIDTHTVNVIENTIMSSEHILGFELEESSYAALAVHLALAIQRIRKNEKIEMSSDLYTEIKNSKEYGLASKLVDKIAMQLELVFPSDEIGFVTMHIKGAKYKKGFVDSSVIQFGESTVANYKLATTINKMIALAEENTGYPLRKMNSLYEKLMDHLRPVIRSNQFSLDNQNPLFEQINDKYKDLYEISRKCVELLRKDFNVMIPNTEIDYIAMYLKTAIERIENENNDFPIYNAVVTCTSGIGASKILAERINKEFQNIHIVDILSTTNLEDYCLTSHNVDLIITTVTLQDTVKPVVKVNPFLMENDVRQLNNVLDSIVIKDTLDQLDVDFVDVSKNFEKSLHYNVAIMELLRNFNLIDNVTHCDFKHFIKGISEELVNDKNDALLLRDEFIKKEKMGSVFFEEEKIIFLQCRSEVVDTLRILIYRNKESINYKDTTVNTGFVMVAPKEISCEYIEVLSEISKLLVNDLTFLTSLTDGTFLEVVTSIQNCLSRFFVSKIVEIIGGK